MPDSVLRGLNMVYPLKFLRIIGVGHIAILSAEKNKNLENQVIFSGSSWGWLELNHTLRSLIFFCFYLFLFFTKAVNVDVENIELGTPKNLFGESKRSIQFSF